MTSNASLDLDMDDIKRHYKKVSQRRFKRFGKGRRYRVDRWMFQAAMFMILAWLLFIANWYHYDLDYYKCPKGNTYQESPVLDGELQFKSPRINVGCKNPFYKPHRAWKSQEYLPPGEYGTVLGPVFHSASVAPFLIFGLAIGLNHIIHNRRRGSR